jgi:hypothetical protein
MRLALVAFALMLPAVSPAGTPVQSKAGQAAALAPICGQEMKVRPAGVRPPARARRLGELPTGDLTLTVLNRVGDCLEPVTVRQGYGGR